MDIKVSCKVLLPFIVALALQSCSDIGKTADEHYQQAFVYYNQNDRESAVVELKNSLKKNTRHIESRKLLGAIYLENADFELAEKELERAIALSPKDPEIEILYAKALIELRNISEFEKLLQDVEGWTLDDQATAVSLKIEVFLQKGELAEAELLLDMASTLPENSALLYANALVLSSRQQFAVANDYLTEALNKKPSFIKAIVLKADIAAFEGKADKALSLYQEASLLQPNSNLLKMNVVRILVAKEQLDEAKNLVGQILNRAPDYPEANYYGALLALKEKDYTKAYNLSDKALSYVPEHMPSNYVKASAAYSLSRYEQALRSITKVYSNNPMHIPSAKLMAATQLKLGMHEKAIQVLSKLGEDNFDVDDIDLLYAASNAAFKEGFTDSRKLFLNNVRELMPDAIEPDLDITLAYLSDKDIKGSLESAQQAIKKNPKSVSARLLLISIYMSDRNYEVAQQEIDGFLQDFPEDTNGQVLQSVLWIENGQYEKAEVLLKKVLAKQPSDVNASHNLAVIYLRQQDFEKAKAVYLASLQHNAKHIRTLRQLYSIDLTLDYENAFEWLRLAIESGDTSLSAALAAAEYLYLAEEYTKSAEYISPFRKEANNNYRVAILFAQLARTDKQLEESVDYLSQAININSEVFFPYYWRALSLEQLGQFQSALSDLNRVLLLEPSYVAGYERKIALLLMLGKQVEAKQTIDQLTLVAPEQTSTRMLYATWLARNKQYDLAIDIFQDQLKKQKNNQYHRELNNVLLEVGREEEAINNMKEWLKEHPKDLLTLKVLVNAYFKAGRNSEAIPSLRKIIEISPKDVLALNNLSYLLLQNDEAEEALTHIESAMTLEPQNPFLIHTHSQILMATGKIEQALKQILKADAITPLNIAILYTKALIQIESQNQQDAIVSLESIMAQRPKSEKDLLIIKKSTEKLRELKS
ncbi:XrtA/PEP-CTERM system TPR-repeat protein PrsT [Thalassotalea euphylliae]|uniref:PEP-CTERM system TPR-repeat protein PrsT n=1 Tax=Thalassotalea euphylliae TaxID=1655234 RepID=A0A3E0UJD6_9GAMM|nr:XrtA/PEP-CTERM system TPR-repeat protein PrsT [Thalassotalea euphylliae]REL37061.1 PEP-CTERM system TPR-repeat protein PrsT [Thalassotalea euphylliae]